MADLEPRLIKYGTITNLWVAKNPPGKQVLAESTHMNSLLRLARGVMAARLTSESTRNRGTTGKSLDTEKIGISDIWLNLLPC